MKKDCLSRRKFVCLATSGAIIGGVLSPVSVVQARAILKKSIGESPIEELSWREINRVIYGAKPDQRGKIGGGAGYNRIAVKGDYTVSTLPELIEALKVAKSGEVVFIPAETEIDLTTHIYIHKLVLEIPSGVTLAGNRGEGASKGAILTSDTLDTPLMIRALGPDVRITGLRIQGPNPKRHVEHHTKSFGPGGEGRSYYYKFPVSNGIDTRFPRLRVDNCDISAFSGSGILLNKGDGHQIHHNYIHHCQYKGLGYGVSHDVSLSVIEFNIFDSNRHSIAGTGAPGSGYVARNNIELGVSLSHCFDMHGGRDRKDGTQIAGSILEIYNNTFRSTEAAVVVRGIPEDKCIIYKNWILKHRDAGRAVRAEERTTVYDNLYGESDAVVK